MRFDVAAEAYDRFMGRYSVLLAPQMADLAGVVPDQRVVDVGCGTGSLVHELVDRLGAASVAAVDPSEPFVEATTSRYPALTSVAPRRRHCRSRTRRSTRPSPSWSCTSWPIRSRALARCGA
ncbi:hypothetical protein BH20CHL7_BH20CHL7_03970 [soil metagenome]